MALGGSSGGSGGTSGAIRAGEAFVEMRVDDSKFNDVLDKLINRLRNLGSTIRNVGLGAVGLGTAILTPFAAAITSAVLYGDAIQDVADRLGTTSEAVSRMGYAADLSASSIEELEKATNFLNKATLAATEGSQAQVDAFKKLGISPQEFIDLELDEKYLAITDVLDEMDDSTEKASLKFALFGKSAAALNPLLDQGSEALEKLLERSDKIGQTISSEDTANAAALKDIFDELGKLGKFAIIEVGKSFFGLTGSVKDAHEVLVDFVAQLRGWIKDNRELIVTITSVGAGIVAGGIALTVFGLAVTGVGAGLSGMIAVLGLLKAAIVGTFTVALSPIGLTTIAIGLVTANIVALSDTAGTLGEEFFKAFDSIKEIAGETISGIQSALKGANFELAFKIAWTGIRAIWAEGTQFITLQWDKFKAYFVDGFRDSVAGIRLLWSDLTTWLAKSFVSIGEFIGSTLASAVNLVSDALSAVGIDVGRIDIEGVKKGADDIRRAIDDDRKNEESRILRERLAKQEEDNKFRTENQAAGQAEIDRIKAELRALNEQAKAGELQGPNFGNRIKRDSVAMANGIAEAVRGAFQSTNFSSVFTFGPAASEAKKQTDELKDVNSNLEDIKSKIGGTFE